MPDAGVFVVRPLGYRLSSFAKASEDKVAGVTKGERAFAA